MPQVSNINSWPVISHYSAPASLWVLIASKEFGGLPSAVCLPPVLFIEQCLFPLVLSLVFQKLFTLKQPNRLTSLLIMPEPDFILYRDGENAANPNSGHTLPPVYWSINTCVIQFLVQKHILPLFTALLFFPKPPNWSLEWSQETDTMALHHPWHSPGESGQKIFYFRNSQNHSIHVKLSSCILIPWGPSRPYNHFAIQTCWVSCLNAQHIHILHCLSLTCYIN